jgi:hypothetical protein
VTPFELTVSLPTDLRFVEALVAVAGYAASHAGCADAMAGEFAAAVDAAVRGCIERGGGEPAIDITFRQTATEIEATFSCGGPVRVARPAPNDR